MADEVTEAAQRLLNEVALHRAMALPSENESFTDDVELVARSVAELDAAARRALDRYDREDDGTLHTRDGLAWAMASDLREALGEGKPR
jgi:hypothetical protein